MRKYFMLIVTVFMLLLTTSAYKYENSGQAPQYTQPSISIESQRFGLIKKIIWTTKYMNDNESLIILSTKNNEQGAISCLYHLNIDTGKSKLLAEFPAHKNLSDVVFFDAAMGPHFIVAAYNKGIVRVSYLTDETGSATQDRIEIAGFDIATSMDVKGNLVYTRENDNLLYVKNLSMGSFSMLFTNNAVKDVTTYYAKPINIANLNSLDNMIAYTSINKNRLDLFAIQDGVPVNTLNKPIIKDVVTARGIEDTFGFAGINRLNSSESNGKLNVFMIRRTVDDYNSDDYYSLDTIPYNTDPFGAVPAVDSTTFNREFSLAYTSYDENHKGSIKICGYNKEPKDIISSENIFGPISMTQLMNVSTNSAYILYFTLENDNVRIKICDGKGEPVKDITDMVIK
jgi:hypothetical protein